jgi:hypothetical protein
MQVPSLTLEGPKDAALAKQDLGRKDTPDQHRGGRQRGRRRNAMRNQSWLKLQERKKKKMLLSTRLKLAMHDVAFA